MIFLNKNAKACAAACRFALTPIDTFPTLSSVDGGLQAAPELNGALAECGELELTSQRYSVRLPRCFLVHLHSCLDGVRAGNCGLIIDSCVYCLHDISLTCYQTILVAEVTENRYPDPIGDFGLCWNFRVLSAPCAARYDSYSHSTAEVTLADGKDTVKKVKER